MDILADGLRDYLVDVQLRPDTALTIESCRLFDENTYEIKPDCVYLVCDSTNLRALTAMKLPPKSNLIVLNSTEYGDVCLEGVNVIFISGIQPYQAINLVLSIFDRYNMLSDQLEKAFSGSAHLQTIVDIATDIIGLPICMLEMNHCVLAMSSNLEPEGDSLWDAMKAGYGYLHYSIIDVSQPKLHEMDHSGLDVWENRNNISGRYIRVYLLRKANRGVASFGLHKLSDVTKPFDKHKIQLADWVVAKLTSRLEMFSEVKIGRGMLSEAFLIDLLEGQQYPEDELSKMMEALSISATSRYYLGIVLFQNKDPEPTEYDFALMDYIETILSGSKCVEYGQRLVFLYPVDESSPYPNIVLNHDLPHFLQTHGRYCLMSSMFFSLLELKQIFEVMVDVIPFVSSAQAKSNEVKLYRYHEFAQLHAISLYEQRVPLKFAENELVLKIIRYDEENNSEYYHTLVEYLRNFGNTTATSEKLHLHRNSLLYRISKIEKIIGCSLEDRSFRQSAMFSILCNDYIREFGPNNPEEFQDPSAN